MKYKVIDRCPVPAGLYDELVAIKADCGVVYNSIYRGDDARALLNANGKSSQKELYDGFAAGRPGFNPANPPGFSTHECRSDGVAYPTWTRGARIPYWAVGIDCTWVSGFVQAAARRGFTASLTYPGNPRETHHANFRKEPRIKLFRNLKHGSRGPRVGQLTKRLVYLGFLGEPTGRYTTQVEFAVKNFQRNYQQKADGIYGKQTQRQLLVALRNKKKCRKSALGIRNKERQRAALDRCGRRFGPQKEN